MFLRQIDLTTALRPALLPDEVLLFVQDAVGLYEGKYKIPDFQDGQAYLTSHRAYYVDNEEPRKRAVAIDLKEVERCELYAGFLKSSPKITLYPKVSRRASQRSPNSSNADITASLNSSPRGSSPLHQTLEPPASRLSVIATWICPICSFSNPVPANFDPTIANVNTPLPACRACGIKPPLVHMLKAALASLQRQSNDSNVTNQTNSPGPTTLPVHPKSRSSADIGQTLFHCPRCTFENDPSLLACEMCGGPLISGPVGSIRALDGHGRTQSPGPTLSSNPHGTDSGETIKFSFRAGGEKIFHERLKGALVQRKWLLQIAPPAPKSDYSSTVNGFGGSNAGLNPTVGIAGLEQRGMALRKNNEVVIGNAFEDLEALMASAKEIVELAERFASRTRGEGIDQSSETSAMLSQSASALNLVTTRDMLNSGSGSGSLYLSELSRNLAEFMTDDSTGILKQEGGIISLVDLWAVFNRARGGVELVSPTDFRQAAELWEKLKLPLRLRKFKSGLLVVQGKDRTDEKTVTSLLSWLADLRNATIPEHGSEEEQGARRHFGRGVTAIETADRFGWSVGVALEELEMAEDQGALCREVGIQGVAFWENWLVRELSVDIPGNTYQY